jgi:hypothetical protein
MAGSSEDGIKKFTIIYIYTNHAVGNYGPTSLA